MKTLSVVVPVYFNEKSLPTLFLKLRDVEFRLLDEQIKLELIFVDDGSGDHSFVELMKIKEQRPDTKVIKLTRNFGAIHASKTGCRFATGDCFMILAADLQDPPELIFQLIEKWKKGSKFTICTRSTREDPRLTQLFAKVYYWLVRRLVDKTYPTGGFDIALMDKTLLPYLINSNKNIYTPLYMYWLGFKPTIIEYHRPKRPHDHSRWTFKKKITACLNSILGFSIIPIRLITATGLLVSLSSMLFAMVIIVNAFLGKFAVPGFPTIVSLICLLLGLIIVMLGIIGEYLWRTFDSVNARPESVIDEIY